MAEKGATKWKVPDLPGGLTIKWQSCPMEGSSVWTPHPFTRPLATERSTGRNLDVEVALNNRPSTYLDEDIQLPVLTSNSMLHLDSNHLPELQPHPLPEKDLRKRAKVPQKCKVVMWKRWTTEQLYVRSLRDSHHPAGKNINCATHTLETSS